MIQDIVPTAKMDDVGVSPKYWADPSRDHFIIPSVPNVEESHSDDTDQDSEQGNHPQQYIII